MAVAPEVPPERLLGKGEKVSSQRSVPEQIAFVVVGENARKGRQRASRVYELTELDGKAVESDATDLKRSGFVDEVDALGDLLLQVGDHLVEPLLLVCGELAKAEHLQIR
eukprot:scaffold181165_cov31-Tisochrysis_lutea.AAC.3